MWLVDPKKYEIHYEDGKPWMVIEHDIIFLEFWDKINENVYQSNDGMLYKAIISDDGKTASVAVFVREEHPIGLWNMWILFEHGYIPLEIYESAKEYASRLNQQPTIYTDSNVFDYATDDEDDGI